MTFEHVLVIQSFSPHGEGELAEGEQSGCNKVGASSCRRLSSAEAGGVLVGCSFGMGVDV